MAPLFPQSGMFPNVRNQMPITNSYQANQPPAMSINIPTMLQQPSNTPNPILVGVHGLDSVKQFPFKPNQTLSFHDLDADFEYIVDTDVNNQPSFKILKFSQITEDEYREEYAKAVNKDLGLPTAEEYAALIKEHNEALKRLEKLEKEVSANAQQSIRYQKSGSNNADSSAKPATRPANTRDVSEVKPQQ